MPAPPTFLLLHGAFQGGWCFDRLSAIMRAKGHDLIVPTLVATADATVSRHIEQIVEIVIRAPARNVLLCGHSYGGMIATAVADQHPTRIFALALLDAPLPQDGLSVLDQVARLDPGAADSIIAAAESCGGALIPPEKAAVYGLNSDLAAEFDRRSIPQPLASFTEPFAITGQYRAVAHKLHILATGWKSENLRSIHDQLKMSGEWTAAAIATGHQVMLDDPEALAAILSAFAADALEPRASSAISY